MFGIAPEKLLVLLAVGFILLGPEKMPTLARDAARMLRTLRDLARDARGQLNSELGPEFANFDLNSLNPRTAVRNALLGEDSDDWGGLNLTAQVQRALRGEDEPAQARAAAAETPPARPAPLQTPFDADAT